MKTFGNILWFILFGLPLCFVLLLGIAMCYLCLFLIPIGNKLACNFGAIAFPFKTVIKVNQCKGYTNFANILWAIGPGIHFCLGFFGFGVICFVTLIGIPFGFQFFKLAPLLLLPASHTYESQ